MALLARNSHAELLGWRPEGSNPCQRLGTRTPPPRDRVATWDEIFALLDAAAALGLSATGNAMLISLLTGQRQTDVLGARAGDFYMLDPHRLPVQPGLGDHDAHRPIWVWDFTRSKRGNAALIELHPRLIPVISQLVMRAEGPEQKLLIDDLTGRPFSRDTFASRFKKIRTEAANRTPSVASLQFRDLRRTNAVMAREAGASIDDVGDLLGNSAARNPRLKQTYMAPGFHAARRAVSAIQWPERNRAKKIEEE